MLLQSSPDYENINLVSGKIQPDFVCRSPRLNVYKYIKRFEEYTKAFNNNNKSNFMNNNYDENINNCIPSTSSFSNTAKSPSTSSLQEPVKKHKICNKCNKNILYHEFNEHQKICSATSKNNVILNNTSEFPSTNCPYCKREIFDNELNFHLKNCDKSRDEINKRSTNVNLKTTNKVSVIKNNEKCFLDCPSCCMSIKASMLNNHLEKCLPSFDDEL